MESLYNASDHLNFNNDQEIKKMILDEKILYTNTIIKVNDWHMSQERNMIITNKAVYNLKKKGKK